MSLCGNPNRPHYGSCPSACPSVRHELVERHRKTKVCANCFYSVTNLVYSYVVISVFPRPSFRAIVSALWCFLVFFHSCFYLSSRILTSDVNKARPLKAKAKATVPRPRPHSQGHPIMQRLAITDEVVKFCFFSTLKSLI